MADEKAYYWIKFVCHEGITFGRLYKAKDAKDALEQCEKECPRSRITDFTKIEDL